MKTFEKYVKNNYESLIEFCVARREGARMTSEKAKEAGGFSTPTHYHFSAKLPLYDEIISELKNNKMPDFESRYSKIYQKLNGKNHWTMKEFQSLTGKLEVLGEISIQR